MLGRGWVAAGDLNEGDEVYLIDGTTAFVTGAVIERLAEPIRVYNLEVEDIHTYFVGDNSVLVHNMYDATDGDGSSLPVPQRTTADNGLDYQSNPKHTPGQTGNNIKAGIEPRNSLDLFNESQLGSDGHRYAYDKENDVLHRFFSDALGELWHWTGSTADANNPLKGNQVPIDIKRFFHLNPKRW